MDNFQIQVVQLPRVASPLCDLAMFNSGNVKCVTIAVGGNYLKATGVPVKTDGKITSATYELTFEDIEVVTQQTAEATSKYITAWAKAYKDRSEKKKNAPNTKNV